MRGSTLPRRAASTCYLFLRREIEILYRLITVSTRNSLFIRISAQAGLSAEQKMKNYLSDGVIASLSAGCGLTFPASPLALPRQRGD
jgi:hypothetical protein